MKSEACKVQSGFTLAEVIIAMSIVVIVGTLLLVILVNNTGLFYQQSTILNQGVGINDSLSKIRTSIKEANAVSANYTSGSTTYTTGSSELVLQLPAIDSSGNKIFNIFDYAVFNITQNRLYLKVFPDSASGSVRKNADLILTQNVDSIKFDYLDNNNQLLINPVQADKVRVTLILKQKAGASFKTTTATSEASLRND